MDERHQPTRLIQPMGMRILVRVLPADARTPAGLYVPATAVKDEATEAMYGEVIEVARAEPEGEEELAGANVSGIPENARVLFLPKAGIRVPWDETLRLVETKNVLAVIEEIAPDAAH
mgnify:CR=1 FL=1